MISNSIIFHILCIFYLFLIFFIIISSIICQVQLFYCFFIVLIYLDFLSAFFISGSLYWYLSCMIFGLGVVCGFWGACWLGVVTWLIIVTSFLRLILFFIFLWSTSVILFGSTIFSMSLKLPKAVQKTQFPCLIVYFIWL